ILADLPKEEELMKIPDYMDYYLSIRNRIKYFVYQNRSGLSLIGDVRFHFIVENSGQVSQVFFDQSLRDNDQIEKVVLKSLKDAAPFSSFPEGLKKHESVPMSMSISFFSR
ncbi:MAG: hypothetical protein PHV17_07765, partial [Candidatus Omnitrophica bacterium]|nr:hypothetical protein [Candidatus Omnitrophota bacterium]